MPPTVLPNEGLEQQHKDMLQVALSLRVPWRLILWTNNLVPTYATVLADLTEATFGGYARVELSPSLWVFQTPAFGCQHATWGLSAVTFPVTSGPTETIYGWAMIDIMAGVIRRVQRFDDVDIAPVVVGVPFALAVNVTLTSAECT